MKLKLWRSLLLGLCLSNAIVYAALKSASQVQAQISPDGTTNTTVNSTDNGIIIDEGDRSGDNLFHSFEQFSVLNGSEAFFNNVNDIVNIFSRVTGGDISNIDGLIRANGDASLFLINPAGIIFGEGAALDIGGSFFASTAESIVFTDNIEFSTTDATEPPLLTINQPLGLNFGNNPGDLAVEVSNLQVDNSETLAFFGGNVTITGGQIIAPGANIELGGLTAAGQIGFTQSENTFNSFSFPEAIARGNVTLTNGAEVNVQAAGGGSINVNARNLELSGGELGESNLSAGIASESSSTEAQAGDITLNATNDITVNQGSFITNNLEESGVGNAGGIKIVTNNLYLTQKSQINSSTFGQGNGGAITIEALDTILIDGVDADGFSSDIEGEITPRSGIISIDGETEAEIPSGIFSQVRQGATGDGGEIDITTTNLSLSAGGKVDASTLGVGDAGGITIEAAENISADGAIQAEIIPSGVFSQVRQGATGDGGEIDITTTNLSLSAGSRVSSTIFGQGNAGAITIKAAEDISADGAIQGVPGGILSIVLNGATGDGGEIDITTTNLSLIEGSQVSTTTFGQGNGGAITIKAAENISADGAGQAGLPSGISSIVFEPATGDSGDIDITTANLSLKQGGAVSASTLGVGDGGAITINASNTIFASGSGIIFIDGINIPATPSTGIFTGAANSGRGNSADISINTSNLFLTNGAGISTQSLGQGNAGNLSIQADTIALSNGAALFASTPVGAGGNINLQIADNLTLQDNSTISAQALENANGGNIEIEADFVIAQPNQNNDIIASAAAEGTGGNINITTNAIFGLESRSSTPPNNTNNIDASSEFGLDGTIQINELEVNPTEALEELPVEVIDVTGLVAQNLCQQGQGSEFVITGKGGTAPSPTQARDGSVSEVDLVEPVPFFGTVLKDTYSEVSPFRDTPSTASHKDAEGKEIVEAKGWVVNDRGMVELVASKTDVDSSTAQPKSTQVCHQ